MNLPVVDALASRAPLELPKYRLVPKDPHFPPNHIIQQYNERRLFSANIHNLTLKTDHNDHSISIPYYHSGNRVVRDNFASGIDQISFNSHNIAINSTLDGDVVVVADGSLHINVHNYISGSRTIPLPDELKGANPLTITALSDGKYLMTFNKIIASSHRAGGIASTELKGIAIVFDPKSETYIELLSNKVEYEPRYVNVNGEYTAFSFEEMDDLKVNHKLVVYNRAFDEILTINDPTSAPVTPVFDGTTKSVYYIGETITANGRKTSIKKVGLSSSYNIDVIIPELPCKPYEIALHQGPDGSLIAVQKDGTFYMIDPGDGFRKISSIKQELKKEGRNLVDIVFHPQNRSIFYYVTDAGTNSDYMLERGSLKTPKKKN